MRTQEVGDSSEGKRLISKESPHTYKRLHTMYTNEIVH